jgi:hypothetical protein
MDSGGAVHEFVEGEGVDLGYLGLGPVMSYRGSNRTDSARGFISVGSVAFVDIVGVTVDFAFKVIAVYI